MGTKDVAPPTLPRRPRLSWWDPAASDWTLITGESGEKWGEHPGVGKKKMIARKVLGVNVGNVARNGSCRACFKMFQHQRKAAGEVWERGGRRHEGTTSMKAKARRLCFRRTEQNYFVSSSPPTH